MSSKSSGGKKEPKSRKKQKTKRKASSPLSDYTEDSTMDSSTGKPGKSVAVSTCQGSVCTDKSSSNTTHRSSGTPSSVYASGMTTPVMSFQPFIPHQHMQPQFQYGDPSRQQIFPMDTTCQSQGPQLTQVQHDVPPRWAVELMEDMKVIKSSLSKIDSIEKSIKLINMKFTDLETKVVDVEKRVKETERSCEFLSVDADTFRYDIKHSKSELKSLNEKCEILRSSNKHCESKIKTMNDKMLDLEDRSMRENLMFYGIQESEPEDCEAVVKKFCEDRLMMQDASGLVFDRVHRLGGPNSRKPRPVVAKFHYYKQREQVRQKSFDMRADLKQTNHGVGIQWPKQVLEARKSLYPIMQREKAKGSTVRMVRDKLFINGQEYNPNKH